MADPPKPPRNGGRFTARRAAQLAAALPVRQSAKTRGKGDDSSLAGANTATARLEAQLAAAKFSRPPLARMTRLRELIAQGKYPNCRTLAEELEVSSKTIQRDLDFMRDRLNMDIAYCEQKHGYFFQSPIADLPPLTLSEGELAALLIAQQALAQYRGTVFERPLAAACQKLADSVGGHISVRWQDLAQAVSFRTVGTAAADHATFATVNRGVMEQIELHFSYHKLGSAQLELRRVRPYHLGCRENQWYCFGHDLDREQIRIFALSRMSRLLLTGTTFQRPADFSIEQLLSGSFGVFRGAAGTLKTVRLQFDAFAARLVRERFWHDSQEIKALPNGELELRLRLDNLEEVERWVLSWGAHARVLAPKELRQRIRNIALTVAAELADA